MNNPLINAGVNETEKKSESTCLGQKCWSNAIEFIGKGRKINFLRPLDCTLLVKRGNSIPSICVCANIVSK